MGILNPNREPPTPRQRLVRLAVVGIVGTQIVTTVFLSIVAKKIIKE